MVNAGCTYCNPVDAGKLKGDAEGGLQVRAGLVELQEGSDIGGLPRSVGGASAERAHAPSPVWADTEARAEFFGNMETVGDNG